MKQQLLTFLAVTCLILVSHAQDYCLELDEANAQRVRYLTSSGDILDTKLNGATDYTIEVWVKPTSTDIHNNVILKRWNQFALTLYQDDNKRFYFTHYAPSTTGANTYVNTKYNVININEWNHLVVINDGTANTLKLYANGVEVTGDTSGNPTTQTALPLDAAPSASNLYVGYGGTGTYLTAQVDKIRIKNTAESIASLQTSVTDAAYTVDANTAVLYNFDEGSGLASVNEADSENGIFQCNAGDCVAGETWWVDLSTTLTSKAFNTTSFKLFPNPAKNKQFIVQAKNNESLLGIVIYDVFGKTVKKEDFKSTTFYTDINVNNLKSGVYIIKVNTTEGVGTQKLIIK
ncbi:hypothetical protein BWZ22_11680 [Seonamhaeicola sp. S2-3]|uniref:LamG-like jellyroll fold domain-containing protein n=1 Tax=Seonamhaeicola sp. S2-3 TaxID=1936081 RepID=UPI00097275A6|nr:LamG-like jellyroll fold domain-containing protein [Seonamhaeicola sp. S2-3]APY11852.1 hypothetical protein BWZ22_11680 [Seonamhaeicola sp. S2-3]